MIPPGSAQIVNGYFINDANNWTQYSLGTGNTEWLEFWGYEDSSNVRMVVGHPKDITSAGTASFTQYVDVTGYGKLRFYSKTSLWEPGEVEGLGATGIASVGPSSVSLGNTFNGWSFYELDIVGSGVQEVKFELDGWVTIIQSVNRYSQFAIDNVELIDQYQFKLSGYVTDSDGDPMEASVCLDNSGGETTSNDTTGYYEFTWVETGNYTLTVTKPTQQDYTDIISISGNTEKNITMTRLSPVLTWTDADTTVTDVFLKWKRNIVVDNVRIYKDTETRLLTTVGSGGYLSGMYNDKNLDCNKGYVYWLQPMDGSVAGPKYRIDAKTDPCTDGGGGGTVPDPTPDLTPVVTPGPTVPPEINMTQEEWLNLTLVEKQDVLANITLMAPVDRLFSPLLEFKWEDVLVWGIHLVLILCAVLALDSITTQKMSEYTGLFAIIPGVVFAYLGGYLVI